MRSRAGFDAKGGLDRDRIWWVQAETLVGFLDAFERYGDTQFLSAAEQVWGFIAGSVIDRTWGEWRWRINPDGTVPPAHPKAHLWKGTCHNGRACLEVLDRTERMAAQDP